jgi:DNA sulfur modification protein DndC
MIMQQQAETLLSQTTSEIREMLAQHREPWVVGFSGGKDSSCVVKLIFNALIGMKLSRGPVTVLYCDTGVEIPPVRQFVWQSLVGLTLESKKYNVDLRCDVAAPRLKDRFFFKIIGRGYVPPTNKFRWCTDRLRIQPVQSYIKSLPGTKRVVVLGLRHGESYDKDQRILRHKTKHRNCLRQSGSANTIIYSPILQYSVQEVWEVLASAFPPSSIDPDRLLQLYRHANGECPMVRDSKSKPCAGSRFGCWTCTVVRRDRAMEGLVEAGHESLRPLLDFRNWLGQLRDQPEQRWRKRRNGAPGPGPFTLSARRLILRRLLATQKKVGFQLIGSDEIEAIRTEWNLDRENDEEITLSAFACV